MLNNENYSLEEVKHIVNSHKIKCNSLKNYFLINLNENNQDAIASKTLGYLGELEYDLDNINNLISNFQIYYQNITQSLKDSSLKEYNLNNEINILKEDLNDAKREINKLKNENCFLKNKENSNKKILDEKLKRNNDEENKNNKLNNTYNEVDNFRNYLNYNSFNTVYNNNNLYEPKNRFEYKIYGRRLTYSRNSNDSYNMPIINNMINNKNNNNISNGINNNIDNINEINNDSDNNKNINSNINNDLNNNINNSVNDIINKNIRDKFKNNFNSNINNITFNNTFNKTNKDLNLNNNTNDYNKENDFLSNNIYPIPKQNYSSYNIPIKQNREMEPKIMNPKPYLPNENENKINRINNILSVISNDDKKYNELKSIYGNNIEEKLMNGNINNENLDKIEKILFNKNKSIIPLSKRFQIQNRAKSNSYKKAKNFLNNNRNINNKNNRFIRQRISEKKIDVKGNKNKWNTSRDFYMNK